MPHDSATVDPDHLVHHSLLWTSSTYEPSRTEAWKPSHAAVMLPFDPFMAAVLKAAIEIRAAGADGSSSAPPVALNHHHKKPFWKPLASLLKKG